MIRTGTGLKDYVRTTIRVPSFPTKHQAVRRTQKALIVGHVKQPSSAMLFSVTNACPLLRSMRGIVKIMVPFWVPIIIRGLI